MSDNVVPFGRKNIEDKDEEKELVKFLRSWADAIESGAEQADAAVLILHQSLGDEFWLRTRRCNVKLLEQIGMMQAALLDVCNETD